MSCNNIYQSSIDNQLKNDNTNFFLGHDYLFYVYLRKGYQMVDMSPPINVSVYSFLSFLQSPTGAKIGQYYTNEHESSLLNYATNADWYWSTSTDTWLQTYSAKSAVQNNKYTGLAHYARFVTSLVTLSVHDSVSTVVQYLYTGKFNITAFIPETNQTTSCPVTVSLGRT